MIIGTGIDLCDISRIENSLSTFGMRFTNRLYTVGEQMRADKNILKRAARYAQMFAAKEACSKALGTGFRQGVFWRDMEVVHLKTGQPTLSIKGGALKRFQFLIKNKGFYLQDVILQSHLTLSDEAGIAAAHVMLEVIENKK